MPHIRIDSRAKTMAYLPGPHLLELLTEAGLLPESPCGGAGVCGKCLVRVSGKGGEGLSPTTDLEREHLTAEQLADNLRLACQVRPQGDIAVEPALPDAWPDAQADSQGVVLASGYLPEVAPDPWIRPPLGTASCFGLAVDIGTTTVVVALVDMTTGKELGTQTAINPQKQYGFDVLTRICAIMEQGEACLARQQRCIADCLNDLSRQLCEAHGVRPDTICAVSVAANTAMLHILCGVDPSSLGRAPYRAVFTCSREFPAADIGLDAHPRARLYCLPSASAFVGADVVAGIYVSGLHTRSDTALFLDIGTNGELALAHEGRIVACSCAAGPALEGMNISQGMRAAQGAIERITLVEGRVLVHSIGNAPPQGLCGSGLLSAISEFLKNGRILPRGNIVKTYSQTLNGKPALMLTDTIGITQGDIRQVQLAKGALLAGVLALLAHHHLEIADIDRVFIAGQFGSHLPPSVLIACGILPPMPEDQVQYLGNTAKSGACLALLSDTCRKEMEGLGDALAYIELSTLPGFEKLFISCLDFPEQR